MSSQDQEPIQLCGHLQRKERAPEHLERKWQRSPGARLGKQDKTEGRERSGYMGADTGALDWDSMLPRGPGKSPHTTDLEELQKYICESEIPKIPVGSKSCPCLKGQDALK